MAARTGAMRWNFFDEAWRFRDLLDALPVAIYMADADGQISFLIAPQWSFRGRKPELSSDQWCVTLRLYWPDGRPMAHDDCLMTRTLEENRSIRNGEASRASRRDTRAVHGLSNPAS